MRACPVSGPRAALTCRPPPCPRLLGSAGSVSGLAQPDPEPSLSREEPQIGSQSTLALLLALRLSGLQFPEGFGGKEQELTSRKHLLCSQPCACYGMFTRAVEPGASSSFLFYRQEVGAQKARTFRAQGQARAECALSVSSTLPPLLPIPACPAAPNCSGPYPRRSPVPQGQLAFL